MNSKFTSNLNALIQKDPRTAAVIASAAGIGASYLSQMRKGGKSAPSMDVVLRLAKVFDVPVEEITGGEAVNFTDDESTYGPKRTVPRDARLRSLEEAQTADGPAHGLLVLNGRLEDLKGKPVQLKRDMETLRRMADYLISQDPVLAAEEKWWEDFDAKHASKEPPSEPVKP